MKSILLTLALAATTLGFGQYTYSISSQPGNPGGIMQEDEFPNPGGANGWTVILNSGASAWSPVQTIPFPFQFNGSTVSTYKVSPNGVVTFDVGATANPGSTPATLPSANIPDNSVCAWGWDMSGGNDEVSVNTLGSAGSQQHWVFFTSMTQPSDASCWHYWGIAFEEGTNNIYVVDMRNSCPTALTVGVQVDANTAYMVCGSPAIDALSAIDATSADNYYYEFTPGSPSALDMASSSFTMAPFLQLANAPFTVTSDFVNNGSATITSLDVNYTIDGGTPVTSSVTGLSIPPCGTYTVSHPTPWNPSVANAYNVEVYVSNLNGNPDGNPANDIASGAVSVVSAFTQRLPLYETFTSSTCGPCTPANITLEGLFNDPANAGKFTSLKYQMSWPGSGDPYFTAEGGERRSDYGINSVPRLEVDGGWDQNAGGVTQQLMDQWAAVPAFVDMTLDYSVWSQEVTFDITIDPVSTNPSQNVRLYVAIFEYETFNNVGTNGEVDFQHVMKKMVPNANGVALNQLVAGQTQTHSDSYNFVGSYRLPNDAGDPINHSIEHSIEEFSDLGVIAWIQDPTTLEVFQSVTGTLVVGVEEEERLFVSGKIYPNPVLENAVLALDLSSNVNDFNVSIYDNRGRLVSTQNETIATMGRNYINLNTQGLESGLYVVRAASADQQMVLNMSIVK